MPDDATMHQVQASSRDEPQPNAAKCHLEPLQEGDCPFGERWKLQEQTNWRPRAEPLFPPYVAAVFIGPVVLLGLVLLAVVEPNGPPSISEYLAIGFILGTMFGQTTLAGAWTALGPMPLLWRLPLSLAWLGAITLAFTANFASNGGPDAAMIAVLAGLLAAQWLIVQIPLWGLAVFYGLRLHHGSDVRGLTARDRQFGIRQVMVLTLIVAVVLGVGRLLVGNLANQLRNEQFASPDMLIFVYLTVASVLLTLPLLVATIVPRYAWAATLVVLALVAWGTWWQLPLMSRAGAAAGPNVWHIIAINAVSAGWIVLVMGLLRLAGFGANASLLSRLSGEAELATRLPDAGSTS